MIRKIIIVVLTLGAVASGGLSIGGLVAYGVDRDQIVRYEYHCAGRRTGWRSWSPEMLVAIPATIVLLDLRISFSASTNRVHTWHVPVGWFFVAFATYPTLAFLHPRYRRYRRRQRGLCVTCGYDLRVSPDRCPECGMAA